MSVREWTENPADLNVWQLAELAECASPISADSHGGRWLADLRDDWIESTQEDDDRDRDDIIHERVDGCIPIYNWPRWATFADLGAWQEDLDEVGGVTSDMTQNAGVALYMIGERLFRALDAEYGEGDDNA